MTTGSLINNLMGASLPAEPEVGMGVTQLCWTDRHAWTVIAIKSPKRCVIQRDSAIRTDNHGMSDSQAYRFDPDPNGVIIAISLRKDGKWRQVGSESGNTFLIGTRSEYHDYSF